MSAAAPAKKTYLELATEAIASLKDRTGSSTQAIKAYIIANNKSLDFAQVSGAAISVTVEATI